MDMQAVTWYLRTPDETFGPESAEKLLEWARLGRIQPGQEISDDNVVWKRAEEVPFLDMRFSIDIGDGNPRGPFHRAAAEALVASGRLPPTASIVETRAPFESEPESAAGVAASQPSAAVEAPAPAAEPAVRVVEKLVEVPVEKIVEKIVEKEVRVEVPVERIVEKEVVKTVVDETRVKELEALLEEERRHAASLQQQADEASKTSADLRATVAARESEISRLNAAIAALEQQKTQEVLAATRRAEEISANAEAAAKDAAARAKKSDEQIQALEDELRRLPQAASEVADIQAAMYSVMTKEAAELQQMLEAEKAEADAFRARHEARADRLLERRRELLKRAGANIEEMTKRALVDRPEDPRTALLRKELEDLRRLDAKKSLEAERRIRELEHSLAEHTAADRRRAANEMDLTQLKNENQELRAKLQVREKELVEEREAAEAARQRQAQSQQVMVARLASLESPSIGTSASLATNQSREAKLVRLASWMHFKK